MVISDTHGLHRGLRECPECDLFIHAGDFTNNGSAAEIADFNGWLEKIDLPAERKVVIAGNHDMLFQHEPKLARSLLTSCIYLEDSGHSVDGLNLYGSPYTPRFSSREWAFSTKRKSDEWIERWSKVPEDTDILITHGPPRGVLDLTNNPLIHSGTEVEAVGCDHLKERVNQLSALKLHVFGHVHQCYSAPVLERDGVCFANASFMGWNHSPMNSYLTIEI